jgi:diaminopimelate decarboxylase
MTIEPPARVRELAERLGDDDAGLPAYVYDLAGLEAHLAGIRAAIPAGIEVFYAAKSNPDPMVLRAVARQADGLEVSSGGELRHASLTVPGCRLAFGGPGKTPAELAAAVEADTFRFHVESPHELRLLGSAALDANRTVDVLLRVNLAGANPPEVTGGLVMGGKPTSFGMDEVLLDECARWLTAGHPAARRLRLRGVHAHLASGLDAPALLASAARVLDFARAWCDRHGVRDPEFNLGGGMAVDYTRPGERFDWAGYGRGLAAAARPGETLRIEPGRAVTAYCGWYVTRVLDVKRSHGKAFVVVAGGTHHLRTPAAKGHNQPFAVLPVAAWGHDWPRPVAVDEDITTVGQLCTPKDILARDVPVPLVRAGDLVAFGMAGAYAWNISHHDFLMHPPPGFHYVGLPDVTPNEMPRDEGRAGSQEGRDELAHPAKQHRPSGEFRHHGAAHEGGRTGRHQRQLEARYPQQEGRQRDQRADGEGRERRHRRDLR